MLIVSICCSCQKTSQDAKRSVETNTENTNISATSNVNSKIKTYISEGKIIRIDKEKGLIEINHKGTGDFMLPNQAEFYVKEKSMLDGVKVGDDISFALENDSGKQQIIFINR